MRGGVGRQALGPGWPQGQALGRSMNDRRAWTRAGAGPTVLVPKFQSRTGVPSGGWRRQLGGSRARRVQAVGLRPCQPGRDLSRQRLAHSWKLCPWGLSTHGLYDSLPSSPARRWLPAPACISGAGLASLLATRVALCGGAHQGLAWGPTPEARPMAAKALQAGKSPDQ